MISAWVLYLSNNHYYFEELTGSDKLSSVDPLTWGLPKTAQVILTFHKAEFLDAFLYGASIKKW